MTKMDCWYCVLSVLVLLGLVQGEQQASYQAEASTDGEDSEIYVYPAGFKGGRYYYGGVYRGSCQNDGLYYRDEDSFVMCSNGNAYVQPCAPGTRSSGQHRYSPGYYYGYSDFCDINLVDQGYGPAHYAPYGVSEETDETGYGSDATYASKSSTGYGNERSYQQPASSAGYHYGQYIGDKNYNSYSGNPSSYASKDSYGKTSYGTEKDTYSKDLYGKDVYSKPHAYNKQNYQTRDVYEKKETAYEPNTKYQ